MTNVTLIRPAVLTVKLRVSGSLRPIPPLGLAYIAGTLKARGHKVTCIDAPGEALESFRHCSLDDSLLENGLSLEEIIARIPADSPVIGICCMFSFDWPYIRELVKAVRAKFPDTFIVLGGEHATADFDYVLRTAPEVDACILGEGENKIADLVQALEEGIPRAALPGVAMFDRETNTVRKNPERDGNYRIMDVDSIPRPAWDLFPIQNYLERRSGFTSRGKRAIPMMASRGCPHRCTFCSSPQMWTTRWKARNVDDLIDEIKFYVREYQVEQLEFCDLTLVIDKRWITAFCQKLIDEKLGLTWTMPAGTRTEALTPEVLDLMFKSGCHRITYPIDTGSAKTSELVKKKVVHDRSVASLKHALKIGFIVKSSTVFGFPFHTWRDLLLEYFWAVRMAWYGTHDHVFHMFAPIPGSEIHDDLVREGKIVKDDTYIEFLKRTFPSNISTGLSWSPQFSGFTLALACLTGMGVFYCAQYILHPSRCVRTIYRILADKPSTMVELQLTNLRKRILMRCRVRFFGEQRLQS